MLMTGSSRPGCAKFCRAPPGPPTRPLGRTRPARATYQAARPHQARQGHLPGRQAAPGPPGPPTRPPGRTRPARATYQAARPTRPVRATHQAARPTSCATRRTTPTLTSASSNFSRRQAAWGGGRGGALSPDPRRMAGPSEYRAEPRLTPGARRIGPPNYPHRLRLVLPPRHQARPQISSQ